MGTESTSDAPLNDESWAVAQRGPTPVRQGELIRFSILRNQGCLLQCRADRAATFPARTGREHMSSDVTAIVTCMTDAEKPFIRETRQSVRDQTCLARQSSLFSTPIARISEVVKVPDRTHTPKRTWPVGGGPKQRDHRRQDGVRRVSTMFGCRLWA
jgi:hypothetical protein